MRRQLAYVTTRPGVNLRTRILAAGWATTYVYGGKPLQRVTESVAPTPMPDPVGAGRQLAGAGATESDLKPAVWNRILMKP